MSTFVEPMNAADSVDGRLRLLRVSATIYSLLIRIAASLALAALQVPASAQTFTWASPTAGTMNVTVNHPDAHHATVTNNSCATNDGTYTSMSIGVTYSTNLTDWKSTGSAPAPGQTTLEFGTPSTVRLQAVQFDSDGIAIDYIQDGYDLLDENGPLNRGNAVNSGLSKMALQRLKEKAGDPIQVATGADVQSRNLFSFHGARDWNFELHYNSILAAGQTVQSAFGFGWTSGFESSVEVSGTSLILHWDAGSSNVFNLVTGGSGNTYTSVEDGARYDTLTAQSGGGWILVRKDQSSKVFNANGQLVEDIDPHGRVLQISYSAGQLSEIVEPISDTFLSFTYDGAGTVETISDSSGATVDFEYTTSPTLLEPMRVIGSITNQNGVAVTFTYQDYAALYQTIDASGAAVTENFYDAYGCVETQFTDQLNPASNDLSGTPYYFSADEEGVLGSFWSSTVKVTDRDGSVTYDVFDQNFNLTSKYDFGTEPPEAYTYDSSNRVTSGGYSGFAWQYTYDSFGNLLTATDPLGNVTTLTYDSRNNLLTVTDAAGQLTTLTYDSKNNLLSVTNPLSGTTSWTYDGNSLPLTKTLPKGGVYNYTYTDGLLTQVSDPNGVVHLFGYDSDGRLLYVQDALGSRKSYTYDAVGNLLTRANELNQTFTYSYDYRNRVTSITDPTGAVTSYTYDLDSNLLTKTDALGAVTTYVYDQEDRLTKMIDALQRTTTYTNDEIGRLVTLTDPAGKATTYSYDGANRLASVVDALSETNSITYDSRNLIVGVKDPLNRISTATYDSVGRPLTSADPLSRTTQYVYDSLARLTQITDPGSLVTKQGFDADSNMTSVTNPANNSTGLSFDSGDRLTSSSTPSGKTTTTTYDARSLPLTVTQPSGHQTTFSYDSAGRPSTITDGVSTRSYTRDDLGRILTVSENGKVLTRTYDALGRLSSFADGSGNTIGYGYDAIGRLTTLTYPGGNQVTYAYDAAGNLSTVTDWANRITTYTYDSVHRLTKTSRPNGTSQSRTYDSAGQLLQLTELAADGVTVIYSGIYTYDAAGELTNETTIPSLAPLPPNAVQSFDVDDRLLTHNGAATTFDLDGNLLSIASGVTPSSYSYDTRNRLIGAGSLTYTYDSEGRRIALTDATGTTQLAVNPNTVLDQLLVRTAPDGTPTFYVYGIGLLHEQSGSIVHYYHSDRLGNVVALTDGSGSVTDTVNYDAYGSLVSRNGMTNTPFLSLGIWGVQTDSNGLYFQRARYFHPALRRWLNADPAGLAGGLNLYTYVGNNPISGIDPMGLVRWGALGSASLGVVSNGFGVAVGGGLMGVPSGVSQVVGVVVIAKSWYGLEANAVNAWKAATDQNPYSTGSLATDIADAAAPGNHQAQLAATAIDLASDLAVGRFSAAVTADLVGKDVLDANGLTNYGLQYGYWADPGDLGDVAKLFQLSAVGSVGYDQVYRSFFPEKTSNCP